MVAVGAAVALDAAVALGAGVGSGASVSGGGGMRCSTGTAAMSPAVCTTAAATQASGPPGQRISHQVLSGVRPCTAQLSPGRIVPAGA